MSPSARRILDPTELNSNAKDPANIICPYCIARVNTPAAPIAINISFKSRIKTRGSTTESTAVIKIACIAALSALSLSFAPIHRAIREVAPAPKPCASPTITINIGEINPKAASASAPSPATHMLSTI